MEPKINIRDYAEAYISKADIEFLIKEYTYFKDYEIVSIKFDIEKERKYSSTNSEGYYPMPNDTGYEVLNLNGALLKLKRKG